jgi:hypothetical protein
VFHFIEKIESFITLLRACFSWVMKVIKLLFYVHHAFSSYYTANVGFFSFNITHKFYFAGNIMHKLCTCVIKLPLLACSSWILKVIELFFLVKFLSAYN